MRLEGVKIHHRVVLNYTIFKIERVVALTWLLILKSLFPFLQELILKDKTFRELFTRNKLATFLLACLVLVFFLFLKVSDIADKAVSDNALAKQQSGYDSTLIADLKQRIVKLDEEKLALTKLLLKGGGKIPDDITPPVTEDTPKTLVVPQKPDTPNQDAIKPQITAPRPRRPTPDKGFKDYVEDQLKNL